MTTTDLDALVRSYPSLAGMPPRLHGELLRAGQKIQVAADRILFDVGEDATGLPLITQGTVRVVRRVSSGRDVLLYRTGPGDFCVLTAASLLGARPYEATGTVEAALAAVLVPRALVEALIEQHAPLRRAVFSTIAARLCRLMTLVEEVAVARLDQRLAAYLVGLGPSVRTTHQLLADELATAREVVSRILESFELAGLVRLQRGRVDIVDARGLEHLASNPE